MTVLARLVPGAVALAFGVFLVASGSPLWWPWIMPGGALVLAAVNAAGTGDPLSPGPRRDPLSLWLLWVVYVCSGAAVEAIRILPGLWAYQPVYETPHALALLILLGYPVLLGLAVEAHALCTARLGAVLGWLGAILIVVGLNELPNAIAPMWVVPPGRELLVHSLFALGYVAEVAVAVWAWRRIAAGTGRRAGSHSA